MRSSPHDPTNSVTDWFKARTLDAREPRNWSALTTLYLDYNRFCETIGVAPSNRVSKKRFTVALNDHCHQLGRKMIVQPIGGGMQRPETCWPRMLRAPIRVAA